jgi:hypothetical protein
MKKNAPAGLKRLSIRDLHFDSNNANKGTSRGRALLGDSIQQYGAGRSILLDKNNRIIAGNKTAEVAGENGLQNIIVVDTDGNDLVAVRRKDLDLETDRRARNLAILDNRVGELDLEWNADVLQKMFDDGQDMRAIGFNAAEIKDLIGANTKTEPGQDIPEMELKLWEKYDYVVIVASNEIDLQRLHTLLDIKKEKCSFSKSVIKTGVGRIIRAERFFQQIDQLNKLSKRPT